MGQMHRPIGNDVLNKFYRLQVHLSVPVERFDQVLGQLRGLALVVHVHEK